VAPTPHINTDQVVIPGSGILVAWDSDAIRCIMLTPPSPDSIIMDPILPTQDKFPVIEFGIGQFMAPLSHCISFPPSQSWGIAEFNPKSLYWPSSEESMVIFFCQAFQNYPSCLRCASHENVQDYHMHILHDYGQMFEGIEVLANERRADMYSGEGNTLESVE
jgi:hypothetical protein